MELRNGRQGGGSQASPAAPFPLAPQTGLPGRSRVSTHAPRHFLPPGDSPRRPGGPDPPAQADTSHLGLRNLFGKGQSPQSGKHLRDPTRPMCHGGRQGVSGEKGDVSPAGPGGGSVGKCHLVPAPGLQPSDSSGSLWPGRGWWPLSGGEAPPGSPLHTGLLGSWGSGPLPALDVEGGIRPDPRGARRAPGGPGNPRMPPSPQKGCPYLERPTQPGGQKQPSRWPFPVRPLASGPRCSPGSTRRSSGQGGEACTGFTEVWEGLAPVQTDP